MKPKPKGVSVRDITGHLAMGAGLGTFLALTLLVADSRNIFAMIVNSATPELTMMAFLGIFATTFAVGSGLTGLLFTMMEGADR